jgi:ribosomal protein L32
MTFSPKQQLSRVRGRKRYSAWVKLNALRLTNLCALQYDKAGKAIGLAHFASPLTGKYDGRVVIKKKQKKIQKVTKLRA